MGPEREHKHWDSILAETLFHRECCRWKFDSQLFSLNTCRMASCPPSCELTMWICKQAGKMCIRCVIKDHNCCSMHIFCLFVENLQFTEYGGNCWKTIASHWVCWRLYSVTGANNKSFCPWDDERVQTIFKWPCRKCTFFMGSISLSMDTVKEIIHYA